MDYMLYVTMIIIYYCGQVHLRARAVQDQPPQPHQLQALQIPPVPGGRHEAGEGES